MEAERVKHGWQCPECWGADIRRVVYDQEPKFVCQECGCTWGQGKR